MIAKLKGIIEEYGDDYVLLDVQGVCYLAYCSSRSLSALPKIGEAAEMYIEMVVREDFIKLYGFASQSEKAWFSTLVSVQGVGAKVGLAILSTLSPSEISSAIALQDKVMMSRPAGVGPKLAQRIVSELKGKIPDIGSVDDVALGLQSAIGEGSAPSNISDAVSALSNLGYQPAQASSVLAKIVAKEGDEIEVAKLIRLGLKELSS
ncbi:MAG: Holliday junction branch migration protein RuvA [Devosiaceae bacterium]|nr:Holliday junction branch migration protein RuvA [Devosiaceae bacterium]